MFEPEKKYFVKLISTGHACAAAMSISGRLVKGLFFIIALVVGWGSSVYSGDVPEAVFERSELTILSAGNRHHFRIEWAKTSAAHKRGLMERRHMDADAGMLFDFAKSRQVYMWMKNTYIALDMLFVDRSGDIVGIAANTTPHSTKVIASPGKVLAVLELNAGTASRLSIKVGDMVSHEIFGTLSE